MRGATTRCSARENPSEFQSTLLMRGATCWSRRRPPLHRFQSTLLMRGATRYNRSRRRLHDFNPRSSCEERPTAAYHAVACPADFNPRSSCEERLRSELTRLFANIFQSTLLMRGATLSTARKINITGFQSTLLMRGATPKN